MSSQKLSLTLKTQNSILNKLVCREKVDMNILNKLINSNLLKDTFNNKTIADIYTNEKQQLLKYKSIIDTNGYANVKYAKSKNISFGRVFPYKGLGFISIRREIRQTLAKNYYVDLDVENCHVVVLVQICEENGLNCETIKKYVDYREDILKQLMDIFEITREQGKNLFIILLYGGSLNKWFEENDIELIKNELTDFLFDFEKSMKLIEKSITKNNIFILNELEKKKNKTPNDNSVLAYYLQEYECRILECVYNYLTNNNYIINNDCALCLDGIMIPKERYNTQLLQELSDIVFNNIGLRLKFTQKEMKQDYLDILDESQNKNNNIENNNTMILCESDIEASEIIYSRIKDKLIYCYKTLYFKKNNIWLNNIKEIECALLDIVMNSNIYKTDDKGRIKPYVQNYTSGKNIMNTIVKTFAIRNQDDSFYKKFTETTKNKLCFKNGVLDISNKKFIKWEDIKQDDEVYTTFYITNDFNEERNEKIIDEVYNKVFKAVYVDDSVRALQFLCRAMGGNIDDKMWGLFIGPRNCGKGVIENFFKSTFQQYIGTLPCDLFMCERQGSAINDTKKLSWLMDLEFSRITFTQEATFDEDNKNIKIDGNKIKIICSGGDVQKARKNYQDEREFTIQSTLMFSANNFPPITPKNTLEFVCSFSSTRQFKSKEFIEARKEEGAHDNETMLYYEADPEIKMKCNTPEWRDALIYLLMDNYKDKKVMQHNYFEDKEEDNNNIIDTFLKDFKITNNTNDFIDNKMLKNWSNNNKVSFTQHIRPYLITWKCSEKRLDNIRGFIGIKCIKENDKHDFLDL
jgi:hypothetical protein